jgi:hypothetical protein
MNQWNFIQQNDLQTGDRLTRKKGPFSRHHVIFVQTMDGPRIAENQAGKGVQYAFLEDFICEAGATEIRIEKFSGNEAERLTVIPRINDLLGRPYNLFNFNCEHFAELVQNGVAVSKQVGVAALGSLALFIGLLVFAGKRRK